MHKRLALVAVLLALVLAGCQQKVETAATDVTTAGPSTGKELYEYRCSFCHGVAGAGDAPTASGYPNANLADGTFAYGGTKEEVARIIAKGIPGTPMRGFEGSMPPEDIDKVAEYVLSLAKK